MTLLARDSSPLPGPRCYLRNREKFRDFFEKKPSIQFSIERDIEIAHF